jgi:hypothetical protein
MLSIEGIAAPLDFSHSTAFCGYHPHNTSITLVELSTLNKIFRYHSDPDRDFWGFKWASAPQKGLLPPLLFISPFVGGCSVDKCECSSVKAYTVTPLPCINGGIDVVHELMQCVLIPTPILCAIARRVVSHRPAVASQNGKNAHAPSYTIDTWFDQLLPCEDIHSIDAYANHRAREMCISANRYGRF